MNNRTRATCLCLAVALTACNGGAGNERPEASPGPTLPPQPQEPVSPFTYRPCSDYAEATPPSAARSALPGGLWHGQITNEVSRESEPFEMAVTEDGRFWFFIDYDEFIGALETDGNTYSGAGRAYSGGSAWSDGSLQSDVVLGGTIAERDSMTGTWSLAAGDAGCYEAFYDAAVYEQPLTLEQLTGDWSAIDGWGLFYLTLRIHEDGSFLFYDPWDCSHSGRGQLALIDDRYNLFEVQELVPDCPVSATPYTGLLYAGSLSPDGSGFVVNSVVLVIGNDIQSFRIALGH